MVEENVKKY